LGRSTSGPRAERAGSSSATATSTQVRRARRPDAFNGVSFLERSLKCWCYRETKTSESSSPEESSSRSFVPKAAKLASGSTRRNTWSSIAKKSQKERRLKMTTVLRDRLGRPVKHGMVNSPEHRAWGHMKDRCHNPKSQRYDRYGARGIVVCARWRNSFEAFFADVGPRPTAEHSLGRIDNDGNYEPGNVRWETPDQQNANKCDSRIIEHDGRRLTVSQLSRELGVCPRTLYLRLAAGWSPEDTASMPIEKRRWLSVVEVGICKGLLSRGWNLQAIASRFGVCVETVRHIRNGRTHRAVAEASAKEVDQSLKAQQPPAESA
jgi:hypothetical protein